MFKKNRLDIILFEKGMVESREKAKAIIMAGIVYVNNEKITKAGTNIYVNSNVEIRGNALAFVSRGGLKLEKAIEKFKIDLKDKICMDIGASTGGFTDCMLSFGAKKVYAIDVGYGQLAWKLRNDERVINLERTNIRYVTFEKIGEYVNFVSIDVSFISLKLVLPIAYNLLSENGEVVCLIKPQFEAGREKIGKNGVVKDKNVHLEVIKKIIDFSIDNGFVILGLNYSPIKGQKGNIEYLLHITKDKTLQNCEIDINKIVDDSHLSL